MDPVSTPRDVVIWRLQMLMGFYILQAGLLFAYMGVPAFRHALGRFFLPLAVAFMTIVPVVGQSVEFLSYGMLAHTGETLESLQSQAFLEARFLLQTLSMWQMVLLLLGPVLLITWRFGFAKTVFYIVGVAVLDAAVRILGVGVDKVAEFPFTVSVVGITGIRTLSYLLISLIVSRLVAVEQRQRRELAHYASTVEQLTISRERNRLARELHDTLAHTLSAVAVQLEAARSLWQKDSDAAHTLLQQSLDTTRQGLTESRRALQALRASPLEDLGLGMAIRYQAESAAARQGLRLDLNVPEQVNLGSPQIEQDVYRIAQEALVNVDRHAEASHLVVSLEHHDGRLELTIQDDGVGFDSLSLDSATQFGIQGMKERAEGIGGKITIGSRPGSGTVLRLLVEDVDGPRGNL